MSTLWARVENDTVQDIIARPREITISGYKYPKAIFTLWSETELNSISLYTVVRANSVDTRYYYRTNQSFDYDDQTDKVTESFNDVEKSLPTVKALRKQQIKNLFLQKLTEGFMYDATPYDIDATAQANINTEYNVALDTENVTETWPVDYEWRDYQNNYVAMAREDVIAFAIAARNHIRALYQAKWDHDIAIDATGTFSAATSYDITTNWPETAKEALEA